MKFYLFLFAIAFGLAVAGNSAVNRLLQAANNNFSGRMLSKVVQENPDKSLVLSAFSVLTPLAQLTLASDGTTHKELLHAIGLPNDNAILTVFSFIKRKLSSIPGAELKMANRIYIPLYYKLNQHFAVISKNIFKLEVQNIDFADRGKATDIINNWVETETNHRIKNLIKPTDLGGDIRAVLVNALYFKGTWKHPFDVRDTANNLFYLNKEHYKMVPTMHRTGNYKYRQSFSLEAEILEMPYVGGQSSMVIILPTEIDGIRSLINKLQDLTVLDREMLNIDEQKVEVSIPKFKIETKIDLKNILSKMNVTSIFSLGANLSKLLSTREELLVSKAIQKAFIEVNEEGAEASAANVATMVHKSLISQPFFNANHPFFFVLRSNNINLFSGVYHG